jgi:phosphatidylglycerophosphatase GEP4
MSKYKIGQFFNLNGIKMNLNYIFRLKQIKPNLKYSKFSLIKFHEVPKEVKYFVFDKDNTLTLPYENSYANKEIIEKIKEFKEIYGKFNLAVLSNSAGSSDDKNYNELKIIEENLKLKVIIHKYKKPNVYSEIIKHFQDHNNKMQINNNEICIIGDRLLVDIIMGKAFGFYTILVNPIIPTKDNFMVRFIRIFENYILKV